LSLEAEEIPDVSVSFGIEAVPTFIFLKNKQKIGRLDGAHAPELTKLVGYFINFIFVCFCSSLLPLAEIRFRSNIFSNSVVVPLLGNR